MRRQGHETEEKRICCALHYVWEELSRWGQSSALGIKVEECYGAPEQIQALDVCGGCMNLNIPTCINPVPLSIVLAGFTESVSKWEEGKREVTINAGISVDRERYQSSLRYRCECRKAEILSMVASGMTNCPEIAHAIGLGRSTVFVVLSELKEEGKVVTSGIKTHTKWHVAESKAA